MGGGGAVVEAPRSSSGCALWKRGGCVMRGKRTGWTTDVCARSGERPGKAGTASVSGVDAGGFRPKVNVRNLIMGDRNGSVTGHSMLPRRSAVTAAARAGALVIAHQFHHEVQKSAGLCRHVVPGCVVDV